MRERRTYLGSTDIAAIVGLSPWANALDIYNAKVNGFTIEDNEKMKWGRVLENPVLDEYARENGITITARQVFGTYSPLHPFLGGTADAEDDKDEMYEVKTTSAWNKDYDFYIPDYVEIQVQWLMGILRKKTTTVLVLIGGQTLKVFKVEFNAKVFEHLVKKAVDFWLDNVSAQIPPASSQLAIQNIEQRKTYIVNENDEAKQLIDDIKGLRAVSKINDDLIRCAQEKLYSIIADAQIVSFNNKEIARRIIMERESLDKKKLIAKYGSLEDCMTKSTSFQLRIAS